jgi:hypothetical protein
MPSRAHGPHLRCSTNCWNWEKALGKTRLYTDGWGAYERHLAFEQRTVGKQHLQTIESKQGVGKELCNFSHIPPNLVVE